jgi:hypothetical protein
MDIGLHVPQRIIPSWIFIASYLFQPNKSSHMKPLLITAETHFLLFKSPLWQLDLVREEVASSHGVSQAEMASKSTQALSRLVLVLATSRMGRQLYHEIVIGVSREAVPCTSPVVSE